MRIAAGLLATQLTEYSMILLPVPTTRDNKRVSGTDIPLEDTLIGADGKSIVAGYALPGWYKAAAVERGALVLDLSGNEKFLSDNAEITANGALGYLLVTENRAPADIKVGVVGYGRIGSRLVRALLFLGSNVKVYTSKMSTCMELCECGVDCVTVANEQGACDFSGLDVLINTAPKDMSCCFPGGKLPLGLRVIELASGNNFVGVAGVEKLPGIPEKNYPLSAGRVYFEAVKGLLECPDTI